MKRKACVVLVLVLVFALTAGLLPALPRPAYAAGSLVEIAFDNASIVSGSFTGRNNLNAAYDSGENALKLSTTGGADPYISFRVSDVAEVSADLYKYVVVKYRAPRTNSPGLGETQLFWRLSGQGIAEERSTRFVAQYADEYKAQVINLSQASYWSGRLEQIRIDPFADGTVSGNVLYLSSISFCASKAIADQVASGSGGGVRRTTASGQPYTASGYLGESGTGFTVNSGFSMDFSSAVFPSAFNRMRFVYSSSEPLEMSVVYRDNGQTVTDVFYLNAGQGQSFQALVKSYLTKRSLFGSSYYLESGTASSVSKIYVSTCTGRNADFALVDLTTETIPVYLSGLRSKDMDAGNTLYIENGRFRIGVNPVMGGAMNHVQDLTAGVAGLTNLANVHDTGRLIQQSYYGSGAYGSYSPGTYNGGPWNYNPVQGGDQYGNCSRLIDLAVTGTSIYVKTQPQDWSLNNQLTPSYMENTYTLQDDHILVDNVFTDYSQLPHPARHQELPAFYTVSYLNEFSFYNGTRPWSGDALTVRDNLPFWGDPATAGQCYFYMDGRNTETWCAWTSTESNFGVGLYTPNAEILLAGRYSYNGSKSSDADATNYVAPLRTLALSSFSPLRYSYRITTGSKEQIRQTFSKYSGLTSYTVSFNTNGGSAITAQSVAQGSSAARPADPTRDCHSFKGWYTDSACTQAYDFSRPVNGNLELYAGWTESHSLTKTEAVAARCETPGTQACWSCSVCHKLFADQDGKNEIPAPVTIPALGHRYGTPSYAWAADRSSVTASALCQRDASHTLSETVSASYAIVTPAGCESAGEGRYTAAFRNAHFSAQSESVTLPATGHDWGDWVVTKPATSSEAGVETRSCKNDPGHTQTRSIDPLPVTSYTVRFSANGGSGTMADAVVNSGELLTLPACAFDPPSSAQTFERWSAGNPGDQIPVSSDLSILAIWKDIPVAPVLSGLYVSVPPARLSYTEGEAFDGGGMVVMAQYSDGTQRAVMGYSYAPSGSLSTADGQITIRYTEGGITQTTSLPISVTGASGGGTGWITILNAEPGVTYRLYKIFDASVDSAAGHTAYRLPEGKDAAAITGHEKASQWFELGGGASVTAKGDGSAVEAAVRTEDFKAWAKGFAGDPLRSASANAGEATLTFSGLPYGYYFIESGTGALITVDSATPGATVIDKNQPMSAEKFILGTGGKQASGAAKLDLSQRFVIEAAARNWKLDAGSGKSKKVYQLIVEDRMAPGMTYTGAVTVTVNAASLTEVTELSGSSAPRYKITWYTDEALSVPADASTPNAQLRGFRLTIPWTADNTADGAHLYPNDAQLTVSYSAFLDSTKASLIQFNAANRNTAAVRPIGEGEGPGTAEGVPGRLQTETFITELQISKTDAAGEALSGAQFALYGDSRELLYNTGYDFRPSAAGEYWRLRSGSYTKTPPSTDTQAQYDDLSVKYEQYAINAVQSAEPGELTVRAFVDEQGKASFKGLGVGSYTLSETVTPPGYNRAEDIRFTLGFDESTGTWYSSIPGTVTVNGTVLTVTVVNSSGARLPNTGGTGTALLCTAGALLALAALVLLITRRRMAAQA